MSPIVEARGLVKEFGNFRAVDELDFEILEGEFFGMLGPNGAGKTSTIRMIGWKTTLRSSGSTIWRKAMNESRRWCSEGARAGADGRLARTARGAAGPRARRPQQGEIRRVERRAERPTGGAAVILLSWFVAIVLAAWLLGGNVVAVALLGFVASVVLVAVIVVGAVWLSLR